MSHHRLTFGGLLLWLSCSALPTAQTQPVAPVRPVADVYFGTRVIDPYRYMENAKDPEVRAWMKAQADYTASVLGRIPGRQALMKRLWELATGSDVELHPTHPIIRLPNGRVFYHKRAAGDDVFKFYVRDTIDGAERLLIDPETFRKATGKPHAIIYATPSGNGRYLAYGVAPSGSEDAPLRIMDTVTGRALDRPIDRINWGAVSWLEDGSGFLYWRRQALGPGDPPTLKFQNSKTFLHKLGTDPDRDDVVFGKGVTGVYLRPTDFAVAAVIPGCSHVVGFVTGASSPEKALYTVPVAQLRGNETPWKRIARLEDQITQFAAHGDDLYLLTFKNAPRFKVLRTSLSNPDVARAEVVIPPGEAVVQDLAGANDALYVRLRDGADGRILRVAFGPGAKVQAVPMPFAGHVAMSGTHPQLDGVLVTLSSWTKPPRVYSFQPGDDAAKDTRLQPAGKYDHRELVTTVVKVSSHDGILVPLSIIHKRNIELNGRNPTFLNGYGAYGLAYDDAFPRFDPLYLAWLEMGGVVAVAHVRGGGEYGEEWHMGGFKQTKPNTWKDFIACAEYLIQNRYTSPAYLTGSGGSAGGILIGRAMTERPDLFAAAIPFVGLLDMLRAETAPNGVPNIPEFGTVKDPEDFRALYDMSTLVHIKDKEKYPAVLLTHGANDPRVETWHSAKAAARLQAATSSGKPVLLRLDYETGHGVGTTKRQLLEEYADILSFMLWQVGAKEFQPKRQSARTARVVKVVHAMNSRAQGRVPGRDRSEALQARGCSRADTRPCTGRLRLRARRRACGASRASRRCRPRRT